MTISPWLQKENKEEKIRKITLNFYLVPNQRIQHFMVVFYSKPLLIYSEGSQAGRYDTDLQ